MGATRRNSLGAQFSGAQFSRRNSQTPCCPRSQAYIQAAWATYLERLQREQSLLGMTTASPLMGSEPLLSDPRFCRSMRTFRKLRKMCQHPDDDLFVIFKEVLDSRTRLEHRLRDVEEKVRVAAAPPPLTP